MIYVPNYESNQCAYFYSSDTIRVYNSTPRNNSTISYNDYFVNSHYLSRGGSTTFTNYSTLPDCLPSDNVTTSYLYRNDLFDILGCFFLIVGGFWFLLTFLFKPLFRGVKLW